MSEVLTRVRRVVDGTTVVVHTAAGGGARRTSVRVTAGAKAVAVTAIGVTREGCASATGGVYNDGDKSSILSVRWEITYFRRCC